MMNLREKIKKTSCYKRGEFNVSLMLKFVNSFADGKKYSYKALSDELRRMTDEGYLVRGFDRHGRERSCRYTVARSKFLPMRTKTNSEIGVEWPVRSATLPGWR